MNKNIKAGPTDTQIIDLMIDLMADLETIEMETRKIRERVALVSNTLTRGGFVTRGHPGGLS